MSFKKSIFSPSLQLIGGGERDGENGGPVSQIGANRDLKALGESREEEEEE